MESLFTRIGRSKGTCLLSFLMLIVAVLVIVYQVLIVSSLSHRLLPVAVLLLCVSAEVLIYQHILDKTLLNASFRSVLSRLRVEIEELNIGYKTSIWHWLVAALTILVFLNLLNSAMAQLQLSTPDTWRIGDWLINYQGGFVRRGLMGETLFHLSELTNGNIVVFIVVLQLFLYLVFFISTFQLLKSVSFSIVNLMFVFSPAFLLFTINNPLGAFRKEILWFALFSVICQYLLSTKKSLPVGFFIGSGVAACVLVLSHEMLVAFLPYLACAIIIHDKDVTNNLRKLILALIPAGVIAGVLLIFGKGSPLVVIKICDSLKEMAPSACLTEGAISSLAQTTQSAHAMVLSRMTSNSIGIYLLTAFLGLLPIFLFLLSVKFTNFFNKKGTVIWFLAFSAISLICSLPLFWVAVDYGRFIYIHIVSLSLLVFMLNHEKCLNEKKFTPRQILPLLFGIAFIFLWKLIYAGVSMESAFPWFKVFDFIGLN